MWPISLSKGDDLTSYLFSGKTEEDGDYTGFVGKKASFKSNLAIVKPDGKQAYQTKTEGNKAIWEYVPQDSSFTYALKTGDQSDKVNMTLSYFDTNTYFQQLNAWMDNLNEEELAQIESGDNSIVEAKQEELVGQNYVTVLSDVITTGSDGTYEGSITLNPNWPRAAYALTFHYGYSKAGEESNINKNLRVINRNLWGAITFAIPGGFTVKGAALLLTEFAAYVAIESARGELYGEATRNQYNERFPSKGFNHVYAFNTMEPEEVESLSSILSDENKDLIEKLGLIVAFYGAAKIGILAASAIVLLTLIRGRKNG